MYGALLEKKMKTDEIIKSSFLEFLPLLIMIALIPVIKNDWLLVAIYAVLITTLFLVKLEKNELAIFVSAAIILTLFELLFVSTGVETFQRDSLFGIIPLWLPLLWGYAMVAAKRFILYLNSRNENHLNIRIRKHD